MNSCKTHSLPILTLNVRIFPDEKTTQILQTMKHLLVLQLLNIQTDVCDMGEISMARTTVSAEWTWEHVLYRQVTWRCCLFQIISAAEKSWTSLTTTYCCVVWMLLWPANFCKTKTEQPFWASLVKNDLLPECERASAIPAASNIRRNSITIVVAEKCPPFCERINAASGLLRLKVFR